VADEVLDPAAALRVKKATMSCPACGRREWASSGQVKLVDEPHTKVFLLSCKWCGYVRMHDLDLLTPEDS
jgi:predicted nucleic-acid-binding Zn-ribbon protein